MDESAKALVTALMAQLRRLAEDKLNYRANERAQALIDQLGKEFEVSE